MFTVGLAASASADTASPTPVRSVPVGANAVRSRPASRPTASGNELVSSITGKHH